MSQEKRASVLTSILRVQNAFVDFLMDSSDFSTTRET